MLASQLRIFHTHTRTGTVDFISASVADTLLCHVEGRSERLWLYFCNRAWALHSSHMPSRHHQQRVHFVRFFSVWAALSLKRAQRECDCICAYMCPRWLKTEGSECVSVLQFADVLLLGRGAGLQKNGWDSTGAAQTGVYCLCVRLCVCMRACMPACVCERERESSIESQRECVCVCVCVLTCMGLGQLTTVERWRIHAFRLVLLFS